MILLKKSEVAKAKSLDREREIQEGLKVAKRVDALREVSAQEEAALQKFRIETLAQISEEIEEKAEVRDALVKEVLSLQEKRAEALIPLDEKWKEVDASFAANEALRADLLAQEATLEARERNMDTAEAGIKDYETQLRREGQESRALFTEADAKEASAAVLLKNAQLTQQRMERENSVEREKLTEREVHVKSREDAVLEKEQSFRDRKIELDQRERAIADREATLARNIARTTKTL